MLMYHLKFARHCSKHYIYINHLITTTNYSIVSILQTKKLRYREAAQGHPGG